MAAMKNAFQCNLCNEFNTRDNLNAHYYEHQQHDRTRGRRKKVFKCNLCGNEFSSRESLTRHMRTHTGERPLKCNVDDCERAFKQESSLNIHVRHRHSSQRPFKCNFPGCHHTAKSSANLYAHTKVHSDERPFACSFGGCRFRAKHKGTLTRHVKSAHSKAKLFTCSKCAYKTERNDNFKVHVRRHSARRDLKCHHPQCTKSFKSSSDLKRHFSNRHEERNIQCPFPGCGRYAPTKEALKHHAKRHNPFGRPFQCFLCFGYFQTLRNLQNHCTVHTNEKPFKCGHCEHAAARLGDIKSHISSAHAKVEFPIAVHHLDHIQCIRCKITLPSAQFLMHSMTHAVPVVLIERLETRWS